MKKTSVLLTTMVVLAVLFLASCGTGNKKAGDYQVTESGLMYIIHESGSDTAVPRVGTFLDVILTYGTEDSILFDSRTMPTQQKMQIPMTESVHVADLYEGFALMNTGDSATFKIVADSVWTKLFRMPKSPPEFDSVDYIYFHVKLNEVITAEELNRRKEEERALAMENETTDRTAYLAENYPDAKPTESGLYYIRTKKGSGAKPKNGEKVKVHYTGTLLDGTKFDSSVDREEPFEFPIGQGRVIKGWDEGIAMMQKGEKGILVIPSSIGYGPRGSGPVIGPYSTLVFEVELIDIIKE